MALGTPESKVFNRPRIEVNGVSAIPLLVQPIGIPKQNYAKTVSRHPTANRFAEELGRIHGERENQRLSTPRQRSPYGRAIKTRIFSVAKFTNFA